MDISNSNELSKPSILHVSAGLRSSVFLSESRQIFWCGTAGDIKEQKTPVEFDYKFKLPELFAYDNHQIVKIAHSWCNSMSVLYAMIAETATFKVKMNNPTKLKFILNSLSNKWTSKDINPPSIEHVDSHIALKHILKHSIKSKK